MKKLFFWLLVSLSIIPILWSDPSAADDCAQSSLCAANKLYEKRDYAKAYPLYLKLANKGNAEAQGKLGLMFVYGNGVKKNQQKAFDWFLKSAKQGYGNAQGWVGSYYIDYGDKAEAGFKENIGLVLYWWNKADKNNIAWVQTRLADLYKDGHYNYEVYEYDLKENPQKAIELYKKAAKNNHADAQLTLGLAYFYGKLVDSDGVAMDAEQDYEKAFYWLFKAAILRKSEAQTKIGVMYEKGLFVSKNNQQAFNWYEAAAAQDDAIARVNLAYMYENGIGTNKNMKKSIDYYKLAAEQGDVAASYRFMVLVNSAEAVFASEEESKLNKEEAGKFTSKIADWYTRSPDFVATKNLGRYHLGSSNDGVGVRVAYQSFFEYIQLKAEEGDVKAQAALASMYSYGLGVDENSDKAFFWTKKSAEGESPRAQHSLSNMYESEDFISQDIKQAEFWRIQAANNGYKDAQIYLVCRYFNAYACPKYQKDPVEAYKWSILYGDKYYINKWYKKEIQSMTPEQRQEGERRAAAWLVQHPKVVEQHSEQKRAPNNECVKSSMCAANKLYEKGDYLKAYSLYLTKANAGDTEAKTKIAEMYKYGKGVNKSDKKAFEWFLKAAQSDSSYAQSWVGAMYISGEGVDQNLNLSVYWWSKAAKANNTYAQERLANLYRYGHDDYKKITSIKADIKKAIEFYIKAAELGHEDAQLVLGRMYYKGKLVDEQDVPQDYEKAFYWYSKLAIKNNTEAQTRIGAMYEQGLGIGTDYRQAFNWYSVAADKGNALAVINLAYMYEKGRGIDQDILKAAHYYKLAADKGDMAAVFKFATMVNDNLVNFKNEKENADNKEYAEKVITGIDSYWVENRGKLTVTENLAWSLEGSDKEGLGVEKIYQQLFKQIADRSEKGHGNVQLFFGFMYGNGLGTTKDEKNSFIWTQKAAEQDVSEAQNDLGWMYQEGKGIEKNDEQAIYWYEKAAGNGDMNAPFSLFFGYSDIILDCSNGDQKNKFNNDKIEAYKWLTITKNNKLYPDSPKWLIEFINKMTFTEIKEGKQRATQWIVEHPKAASCESTK